jgi:hypothetical protein
MAFKQDEDFLRFLTMGAAGSAALARHLQEECGHRMVELERYTMANKIWGTKVKRLRLPDLMCVDCGLRVESRGKSKLEIKLSDADKNPARAWDAPHRDEDLIGFVTVDPSTFETSERPSYFTVEALRGAVDYSRLGPPKSASEGAERDRTWKASTAGFDGTVEEVVTDRKVKVRRTSDGRRQTYWLPPDVPAHVYVREGDAVYENETFLLGVVEEPASLSCSGHTWRYADDLSADADPVARYSAVKAAGIWKDESTVAELERIAEHDSDERIRLEALASLSRIAPTDWTHRVAAVAADREADPALAMEAMFILSELGTEAAANELLALARNRALDSEARQAAVWGLGAAGLERADLVIDFIDDADDDVAMHALAGIGSLPRELTPLVQAKLRDGDRSAASAMTLLARHGALGAEALLEAAGWEGDARTWALAGLGQLKPEVVRAAAGGRLPEDVARELSPMWVRNGRNWLNSNQPSDSLSYLERQTVRFASPAVA